MIRILLFLLLVAPVWADPVAQLSYPGAEEMGVALSRDGKKALVLTDHEVPVWDVTSRQLIRKPKGFVRVTSASFSPDGKRVAVGDYPRYFGVFDSSNGMKKLWDYHGKWTGGKDPQDAGGYDVRFSPDGSYLLAAGSSHGAQEGDTTVRLFDKNGRLLHEFPQWGGRSHGSGRNLSFSLDGKFLLRGEKKRLEVYSLPSGKKQTEIVLPGDFVRAETHPKGALCTFDVPDRPLSTRLFTIPDLKDLYPNNNQAGIPFQQPGGLLIWGSKDGKLEISLDGLTVFQGGLDDSLRCWVEGGGCVITNDVGESTVLDAKGQKLGAAGTFMTIGKSGTLGVSIGYGNPTKIYNLQTGKLIGQLAFASGVVFSEDGTRFATVTKSGVLLIDVLASVQQSKLVPLR
jgi:WD40 repeat protein